MGISREKLISNKYLLPDKGYETGLRLLHHMGLTTQKDKNAFRVLLEQIHERIGYRTDVLEKDYYVVLMLRELAEKQEAGLPAFFKGGTALYKALKTTNRFSEDIDLSVDTRGCSRSQNVKRLELAAKKYTALARDASAGKMNWSEVISIFTYEPITAYDANDTLQRFGKLKIEATSFTISEPTTSLEISPMLYEPATESEQNILRELPLIAWRRCGSMHWHFARYGHL